MFWKEMVPIHYYADFYVEDWVDLHLLMRLGDFATLLWPGAWAIGCWLNWSSRNKGCTKTLLFDQSMQIVVSWSVPLQ